MERRVFHGAMNDGTVSIAEMMAYVAPLCWYADKVNASEHRRARHIHIITDSQYIQSKGEEGKVREKHVIFWTAFAMFNRLGLQLHWHWLPRESADLNRYADVLSKAARINHEQASLQTVLAKQGLSPDRENPWE